MVSNCAEEGLEVQRGKVGCSGSHSTLVAKQGCFRPEKPHQGTILIWKADLDPPYLSGLSESKMKSRGESAALS